MRGPRHVAAIQDGNRRFAEERGEMPYKGHQRGVETTRRFLRWCCDAGVEEVTVYALSTENLRRDEQELESLFELLADEFREAAVDDEVHGNGMRIRGVGFREVLPAEVREALEFAEEATADNDERVLNVAVGYGGRLELLRAVREVVADSGRSGDMREEIGNRLLPGDDPVGDVDLLIRTGGEKRVSNFLPWQAAGSGCVTYFSDAMWPEFSRDDFDEALELYGRTAESPLLA